MPVEIAAFFYLKYTYGLVPAPFFGAQGAPLSLLHVFFSSAAFLLFSLFFSFYPWAGVSLSKRLC
jgi:hypothetical protein